MSAVSATWLSPFCTCSLPCVCAKPQRPKSVDESAYEKGRLAGLKEAAEQVRRAEVDIPQRERDVLVTAINLLWLRTEKNGDIPGAG